MEVNNVKINLSFDIIIRDAIDSDNYTEADEKLLDIYEGYKELGIILYNKINVKIGNAEAYREGIKYCIYTNAALLCFSNEMKKNNIISILLDILI